MASLSDTINDTGRPIFLVIGLVLSAGYWFMNGSPTTKIDSEIDGLRRKISLTNGKIKEAEASLTNKGKTEEEMERLGLTFKLALEYLPKDLNIHDILRKTYLEARASGVELASFSPKEPPQKQPEFYDEVPLEIHLRGSYGQLLNFLSHMSKLPRIINVRDIEITNPKFVEGSPVMDFRGILVVYRYKETSS